VKSLSLEGKVFGNIRHLFVVPCFSFPQWSQSCMPLNLPAMVVKDVDWSKLRCTTS
jgi:hypothetical protein